MWGLKASPPHLRGILLQLMGLSCLCVVFAAAKIPTIQGNEFGHIAPRRALAAALLDGAVYAVGGWDGQVTQLALVERLQLNSREWQPVSSLNIARSQHTLTQINNQLWVIGGWNAEIGLVSEIEMFDIQQEQWVIVGDLPVPRREPAAVLWNGQIVIAGGFNGRNDADLDGYLSRVDVYDITTTAWRSLPRLNTPRRGLVLVNTNNTLYAIGGYSAERGFLNTVECYDAQQDRWQTLTWNITPRTWMGAVVLDNHIILIGGFNLDGFLGLIESIDPDTGIICYLPPLHVPRAWLAAVPFLDGVLTMGGEETFDNIGGTVEWFDGQCEA